jgi:hypothetical protein
MGWLPNETFVELRGRRGSFSIREDPQPPAALGALWGPSRAARLPTSSPLPVLNSLSLYTWFVRTVAGYGKVSLPTPL